MNGTVEFKKFILSATKNLNLSFLEKDFEKRILDSPSMSILINKTSDILSVRKYHNLQDKIVDDLMMKFRIKRNGSSFDLWPIYFSSVDGRTLNAETVFRDKVLINAKTQDELIEVADTWAKALAAQSFARSLGAQT